MSAEIKATDQYNVGKCPGCRFPIWAKVELEAFAKQPWLNVEGNAEASAHARIVSVVVKHECEGRSE